MTHLLSDPRVVEAAARRIERFGWPYKQNSRAAAKQMLTAAVAALPREELIRAVGRAICAEANERELRRLRADPSYRACLLDYAQWHEEFGGQAVAALVAIGLIPEHVTPEEER